MLHHSTRIAAQLIYCSPTQVLRRAVVELNEQKNIIRLFSLDGNQAESAHTLFFNGIISGEIRSIKQHRTSKEIKPIVSDYHYLDVTNKLPASEIIASNKPLVLDFGTNSPVEINRRLVDLIPFLGAFSILEIIAGCVYYPALVLGESAVLSPNIQAQLLLWEDADLVNNSITEHTRVHSIIRIGSTFRKQ